ncbi:TPA: SpvB/TcaC N-terminal domain-containing protein [Providencia alcalifaciens]
MQHSDHLVLGAPSLPKSGGTISGLKGDIAAAGPDGAATLELPLPISPGRGYAPSLSLSYHSRAGNGPFGMGWNINLLTIRRRTHRGIPTYKASDEFTGPDGEVLVPILQADGSAEIRQACTLLNESLGETYSVHAYQSRVATDFSRVEYWVSQDKNNCDFWVLYSPDGAVHLLGKHIQARLCHTDNPVRTAAWLIESSVSATGEQIYYQYQVENDANWDDSEKRNHPSVAQRYLSAVWYGNRKASRTLPSLMKIPSINDWLFILVADYGERETDIITAPDWLIPGQGDWECREDCFSNWEYGFEIRTRRLCRQFLMYHIISALAEKEEIKTPPQLVSRLLLEYSFSPSFSMLKAAQQVAYEPDGTLCALPPVNFEWQTFCKPDIEDITWQVRDDLANQNPLQSYQMVDLNGEGLAGILYQDSGSWWYRAPERDVAGAPDAVTWGNSTRLSNIPVTREGGALLDLNGDGYLEWVVLTQGIAGYYERTFEREWHHFTPLLTMPVESAHPRALLADITGAGLTDIVLIGPKSVRVYSGTGDGWKKVQSVAQSVGITLPVPNTDAQVLVAFSDVIGSGQQHLVEVRAEGVRYWPNMGYGQFASPVCISGFSQPTETFDPTRLFLADIDGSGTIDLIYALSDHLLIYCNQSGNYFSDPFIVPLPKGVYYDHTCSLQVADIQGLGMASLVLTATVPSPRHWVCYFAEQKPGLISGMNNNMGAVHSLRYRSSPQFWLDEKAEAVAAGKPQPICRLPFALHTLVHTTITDEITGNQLTRKIRYRHGVWDGCEREFLGFGFVEIRDTDVSVDSEASGDISMPTMTKSWYATGLPSVDNRLPEEYWQGDVQAFMGFKPRFTIGSGDDEAVYPIPNEDMAFWLNRGMKGMLLRRECFGADASRLADVPYTVTEMRPQVRVLSADGIYPVVWPVVVESRAYTYERMINDPQCSQQIVLSSDRYGQPLKQVSVCYPRRELGDVRSYPDRLPDGLLMASVDEQQKILRLTLEQKAWHLLSNIPEGVWCIGLEAAARHDVFNVETPFVLEGISREFFHQIDNPLMNDALVTLAGQSRVWYWDDKAHETVDMPAFPPRIAFKEIALLNEEMTTTLSQDFTEEKLTQAGYHAVGYQFARYGETGKKLWAVRQGITTYETERHFWLPVTYRESPLLGAVSVIRDKFDCVITQQEDAAGLIIKAEYDWRFLTPVRVIDVNDNEHSVTYDALGRVTSLRFLGTENHQMTGYSAADFSVPVSADEALCLAPPLPVAQCMVYVTDSWMQVDGERQPPHIVTLTTDRYDHDPAQQIRQQVNFSDGFGRQLQASIRQTGGDSWLYSGDGALAVGRDGELLVEETMFRWAVTGRTEYDNKGQAIRTYQPYFLNHWRYVRDDSARRDLYADTHRYDSLGRVCQVITAKGDLRRTLYTPWFVVNEDENDTAMEKGRFL